MWKLKQKISLAILILKYNVDNLFCCHEFVWKFDDNQNKLSYFECTKCLQKRKLYEKGKEKEGLLYY